MQVVAALSGASPTEVEKKLARVLEASVSPLEGVERIQTRCGHGLLKMEITGKNRDGHPLEATLLQAIDRASKKFPKEAGPPRVRQAKEPPTALVSISALSYPLVVGLADEMLTEMLKRSGVLRVELLGERERRLLIEVDPDRLKAFGLTLTGLADRLISVDLRIPGDLEKLVVMSTPAGNEVRLDDLATLKEELGESGLRVRNGWPTIALVLTLARDQQGEAALAALSDFILKFKKRAPPKTHLALFPLVPTDASTTVVGRLDPVSADRKNILTFVGDILKKTRGRKSPPPPLLEVRGDASEALAPWKSPASAVYFISTPNPQAAESVVGFLQRASDRVTGANTRFANLEDLGKRSNRIELTLCGPDHNLLLDPANRISADLKRFPEVAGITLDVPVLEAELSVEADPARLAELGLTASDLIRAVRLATRGQVIGRIRSGRTDTEVILKSDRVDADNPTELGEILIPTPDGAMLPLFRLASLHHRPALRSLLRIDGKPAVRLEVDLARPFSRKDLDALLGEVRGKLPEGFTVNLETGREE
jgi:multidrug efflux pump subunit AcrB